MKYEKEFKQWFEFMKGKEGGKSSAKTDMASKLTNVEIHTNRGVIFPTWQSVRKLLGKDNSYQAFLKMTEADHIEIAKWFWYQAGADFYANGSLAAFFAEERWAGGGGAIQYYQSLLGLQSDGIVGSKTAEAINRVFANPENWIFLNNLKRRRYQLFILRNSSQKVYEIGWNRRIAEFEKLFKPTSA